MINDLSSCILVRIVTTVILQSLFNFASWLVATANLFFISLSEFISLFSVIPTYIRPAMLYDSET